jgi:hypothetical protein
MKHQLWLEPGDEQTFCLAGEHGNAARALLAPGSKLTWEVEAVSHFEAMKKYHEYMGWGEYTTDFQEQDKKTYKELGLE